MEIASPISCVTRIAVFPKDFNVEDKILKLQLRLIIECGEGLIQEKESRFGDECPDQGGPLTHASRQFPSDRCFTPSSPISMRKSEASFLFSDVTFPCNGQPDQNILFDRLPRKQIILLEHISSFSSLPEMGRPSRLRILLSDP